VIAATNGYVLAQTLGTRAGLASTPREAPLFYGAIFTTLALGAGLAMLPVPTISLLYWVSVAAGLATPLTLALTMLVARNAKAMQGRPISGQLAAAGWAVTAIVTLSAVSFIASLR
jgi:Mn2+/Fe2+ NRAMP family transporter